MVNNVQKLIHLLVVEQTLGLMISAINGSNCSEDSLPMEDPHLKFSQEKILPPDPQALPTQIPKLKLVLMWAQFTFSLYTVGLGSLHKLRLYFLAFGHVRTPLSLHFLCSKFSIFLTTYPPLNANVICEGSPS